MKSLWALCDSVSCKQQFCARCHKTFKNRKSSKREKERLLVDDFFGVNLYVICLMHLWERVGEFAILMITYRRTTWIKTVESIAQKVQYDFHFEDKESYDIFDGCKKLRTSMMKFKYVRQILVILKTNLDSIFRLKGDRINKKTIKNCKVMMERILEILIKMYDTTMSNKRIREDQLDELEILGEELREKILKINKRHFPIYIHYLVMEIIGYIRSYGLLLLFINQGVEKKNQDRVYVLERKIKKNENIMHQQIFIELREWIILKSRIKKLQDSKLFKTKKITDKLVVNPFQSQIPSSDFFLFEFSLEKQENNLKSILNILRKRK